jgi:hypothetical protein
MKRVFIIIALLPIMAQSQVYMAGSMGISRSSYTYNEHGEVEKYYNYYLFFNMPFGYQHNNWLLESGWLYNGKVVIPVTVGRHIPIHKRISADILAGVSDAIDMPFKQKIVATGQIRISSGYVYAHMNIYNDGCLIGIGVKGFILQRRKKTAR